MYEYGFCYWLKWFPLLLEMVSAIAWIHFWFPCHKSGTKLMRMTYIEATYKMVDLWRWLAREVLLYTQIYHSMVTQFHKDTYTTTVTHLLCK